ncbi:MAG: phospholipase D-like domain-containing protein [Gemmatimonadota bacterium]
MRFELLVDSDAFCERLTEDLLAADRRILVQALTFEGDDAGRLIGDALLARPGIDRRVLIDSYTRVILSDRLRFRPANLLDAELRREARETEALVERLRADGVGVRFTNPLGPLLVRFPVRDHKKIIVVDDRIAYIGGINFSDHNFAWHDMMLRVDDPDVAALLRDDFLATWAGEPAPRSGAFDGIEVHTLDGTENGPVFDAVYADRIDRAERSVLVHSPYLTFPFCEPLARACARGLDVTVITPEQNNRPSLRRYIEWEGARCGFDVRLYQGGMSHLKALLVDDECLVMGSANFDFLCYELQPEILAVVTDRGVIDAFRERVVLPDLRRSRPVDGAVPMLRGHLRRLQMRALGGLAVLMSGV